ncbi:MAG: hypothetical protein ACETWB_07760, partial [Anaerolineae bacterium]
FDELYHATVIRGAIRLAEIFFFFDSRWVVDPIINLVGQAGRLVAEVSGAFDLAIIDGLVGSLASLIDVLSDIWRRLQTGYVRNYGLSILLGVVAIIGYFILR